MAASLGAVLAPGMAQAAGPAAPVAQGAPVAGAPSDSLPKPTATRTFHSGAEKSVRKTPSATAPAKGLQAAPQVATAGNPDLAVVLNAWATSAHGVELQSTLMSVPGATLKVTYDWGDGSPVDTADGAPGAEVKLAHRYAELGEYNVKVTVTDAANNAEVVNELPLSTVGSDFTPYAPTRLLDTRNGIGGPRAMVKAYSSTKVQIAGNGGIPKGVTAVALNVTVTNTGSAGHVTAFPGGGERPTTSNLNYEANQSVPNMVIVPVGKDGTVELYNGGWESVDLIADITGYFTQKASSGYTPMTPARFVDTRTGLGTAKGQVAGQATFGTQISGQYGVPGDITAVALNVTVTNPKEAGHLTVFPSGQSAPTTSNVNFTAGQTIANSVIVPVGPDGRINVRNGAWAGTDVIVDVVGYYSPASSGSFMAVKPFRRFDTRTWDGPMYPRGYIWSAISHGEEGIAGYVLNATVTNTKDAGFLSVAPDTNSPDQYQNHTQVEQRRPTASTLNWTAGKTVPNLVQASSGGVNGVIDFWNQSWDTTDLIVDMFGYYETK
ncbi:PKD domain-containing protein [Streptomyces sp. NPDC046866]|uniref:PKD domain-containing protein n=1 Tax=Streptomyces sp. NPDC046866 TaxID=3154921 RepID=UPI003454EBC5